MGVRKLFSILLSLLLFWAVLPCPALAAQALRAPDYESAGDWVYRGYGAEKAADVFLLAPTVEHGGAAGYLMDMDDALARSYFAASVDMQMGLYAGCCRVFAPYYRQAAYGAYTLEAETREAFLSLAYSDVSAAFRWYLDNANQGRPIVLAGYSQGADMVTRLIAEYFGDGALRSRLVAAYAIGWAVTEADVRACPWLTMARGEDDVGVVISFECEAEGLDHSRIVAAGERMLSINPLNWRTDGSFAAALRNRGACFLNPDGTVRQEQPGLTGAYIDPRRGTLICTDIAPEQYPPPRRSFQLGEYHWYDYQFFYRNIQQNAATRLAAWQERQLAAGML